MGSMCVWLETARRGVVRALVLGLLLAVGAAVEARAEQAQEKTEPAIGFTSDAGMIFNTIKPDKTADFEMVMNRLRDALAKSENPVRQKQAASWKLFKSVEPGQGGNILYIMIMDPAIRAEEYDATRLIHEVFPDETQDLFAKLKDAYVSLNKVNLQLVTRLGQ